MESLYSPWRDLLYPDMMCLTKAGKEDRNQPLHLAPLSSLLPFSPSLYGLISNLPTTPFPDCDSFFYLGIDGRRWKREETSPLLCVHSLLIVDIDKTSYITSTNPHNLEKGACIVLFLR